MAWLRTLGLGAGSPTLPWATLPANILPPPHTWDLSPPSPTSYSTGHRLQEGAPSPDPHPNMVESNTVAYKWMLACQQMRIPS